VFREKSSHVRTTVGRRGADRGRRQLIEYFAAGNKPKSAWRMGTEHEKFGFSKKTLKPLPMTGPAAFVPCEA